MDIKQYFDNKTDVEKIAEYNNVLDFLATGDTLTKEFTKHLEEHGGLTLDQILRRFAIAQLALVSELTDWQELKKVMLNSKLFPAKYMNRLIDRMGLDNMTFGKVLAMYIAVSLVNDDLAEELVARGVQFKEEHKEEKKPTAVSILLLTGENDTNVKVIKLSCPEHTYFLKHFGDWRMCTHHDSDTGYLYSEVKEMYAAFMQSKDNINLFNLNEITNKLHHLLDMMDANDYDTISKLVRDMCETMGDFIVL